MMRAMRGPLKPHAIGGAINAACAIGAVCVLLSACGPGGSSPGDTTPIKTQPVVTPPPPVVKEPAPTPAKPKVFATLTTNTKSPSWLRRPLAKAPADPFELRAIVSDVNKRLT